MTTVGWSDVQNAIKQAVIDTEAVGELAVCWTDEQRPAGKVIVILDLVYLQTMQDREDNTEGSTPGLFDWSLSSLYYIRVQARAESVFNAPGYDALFALEKVRAGLLRPDIELDAGIVYQPDNSTYVHHISFPHEGRTVSAYALEMGFRAVLDYPLAGPMDAAPNMVEVDVDVGEVDVGEDDPVEIAAVVDRP